MSFSRTGKMLLAVTLAAGCGKTPCQQSFSALMAAADSPPAEVVERVLAEPQPVPKRKEVPPPPGKGDEYLGSVGQALAGAADKPPVAKSIDPTLLLFSATWCGPCKSEHARVPELAAAGEHILEYDFDRDSDVFKRYGVEMMPTWIRVDANGKEVGRVPKRGQKEYLNSDRDKLLNAHPPIPVGAFGLFEIPPVRLADWIPLIAGGRKEMGWGVSVNVPQNLSWTVRKSGQSLFLDFKPGTCPQISWPVRTVDFQSIEINPAYIEVKTNAWLPVLRTIRLNIDYSPPSAVPPRNAIPDGKKVA